MCWQSLAMQQKEIGQESGICNAALINIATLQRSGLDCELYIGNRRTQRCRASSSKAVQCCKNTSLRSFPCTLHGSQYFSSPLDDLCIDIRISAISKPRYSERQGAASNALAAAACCLCASEFTLQYYFFNVNIKLELDWVKSIEVPELHCQYAQFSKYTSSQIDPGLNSSGIISHCH